MAGLLDVAAAIMQIGAAAKATAQAAREASAEMATAAEAVRSSSSGIQNARTGTPTSMGATDLGDPRNAEDQAARMIASIEAAKRR